MRSKIAQHILDRTPKETKIFVRLYADIVVRVHELIKEKGLTQKQLAEGMNKKPSEISKWLNGEHNLTLRSLAKLEAVLGEPLIYVPKRRTFRRVGGKSFSMTAYANRKPQNKTAYIQGKTIQFASKIEVA